MKEHTRQTKKQKLEQRITPEVAQIVFIYKGQERLSYINTRNCSAGNGADPLFMTPGGYRWDHGRVCPAGFGLKVPGPIKTGPKPRTVRLKKKVRALFDVVWSVFSTDLPCVSARTYFFFCLNDIFPMRWEWPRGPKVPVRAARSHAGFVLKASSAGTSPMHSVWENAFSSKTLCF